ncbi:MAG: uracil phosphoribosyltransferase [Cyanobacteria bacterium]|jgi:uracil phosphoribosyltransferase|nr:uracil phosphoribosyltransferase [Cyanobacteriota bacterium]
MITSALYPSVTLCDHPLVQHNLSILRDKSTNNELFRSAIQRIGGFLFQEAARDLPLTKTIVETPLSKTEASILSPEVPIIISPILRAGLILADVAISILPSASVYHIGLYRDEETLKPVTYYNKMPSNLDYGRARIFLLDPMLATGGSAVAAVDIIQQLGVLSENIRFISVISAPDGIQHLSSRHPKLKIFTGSIDERLNEKAYIVPGLGDAGDRTFGTV